MSDGRGLARKIARRVGARRAFLPVGLTLPASSDLVGSVEIRGAGGLVQIGEDCLIEGTLVTETPASRLSIGSNSYVGGGSVIDCVERIVIGSDVLISYGCILADSDSHNVHYEVRRDDLRAWKDGRRANWDHTETAPIELADGVWVGARAIILKGVTIGTGAVVGAGSVVTRDVPPATIVAGNPARVVRTIS